METQLAPVNVGDVLPKLRRILMQIKTAYDTSPSKEGREALTSIEELVEDFLDIQESENALLETNPDDLIFWTDLEQELGPD